MGRIEPATADVDFAPPPCWTLLRDCRYFAADEVELTDSPRVPFKRGYEASTGMPDLGAGF